MKRVQNVERLARKDLNLLVVFRAIAEAGSVSGAADRLALSQPAVSHALNRLRQTFDDPLFVRGRDGLRPTALAKTIIDPVREALAQIEAIFEKPVFDPSTETRSFRIAASDFTATAVLAPLLQELARTAPGVGFAVQGVEGRVSEQLENGNLELSFAVQAEPPHQLRYVELLRDRFVGVMQKHHPLAAVLAERTISLEEYLRYPHVAISIETGLVDHPDRRLVRLAGARQVRAYFPNFVSGLASLVDTDFLMTIPARLGARLVQRFELVQFELPVALDPEPYYLLWHRRTDQDPGLIWLREFITTRCQEIGLADGAADASPLDLS